MVVGEGWIEVGEEEVKGYYEDLQCCIVGQWGEFFDFIPNLSSLIRWVVDG